MSALRTAPAPPLSSWAPPAPPSTPTVLRPGPASAGGWVRRLWPIFAAHRRVIVIAFVASIFAVVAEALNPLVQRQILDKAIFTHERPLLPLLLAMAGLFLVRYVAGWVRRFLGGRISWEVDCDLRNAVFAHLQGLDFARHDELQTGQLVSRTNSDLTLVRQLLNQVPTLLANSLQSLFALVIMAFVSWEFALGGTADDPDPLLLLAEDAPRRLPLAVGGAGAHGRDGRRRRRGGHRRPGREGLRAGAARARAASPSAARRCSSARGCQLVRLRARRSSTACRRSRSSARSPCSPSAASSRSRARSPSARSSPSSPTSRSSPPRPADGRALIAIAQQARAGAERVLELLDSLPDVTERRRRGRRSPSSKGEISFDDVRFGYLRSEPVLALPISTVAPGETIAIVGASGSGKSTIALLLPRFYDVQQGAVRIDGIDVRDLTLDSPARARSAWSSRTRFLFSDTIRANIAYGRPEATEEDDRGRGPCGRGARFIGALPDGYDTVVGERGLHALGRPAPAHHPRPGAPQRPADPAPRRRHLLDRRRVEEEIHADAAAADGRAHDDPDRPPPLDPATCRPHRRPRAVAASLDSGSHEELMARCAPRTA